MESSVIAADPQALWAVQPAVHNLADAVEGIATELTSALEVEGRCWGSDEWGTAFAASYLPASSAVRSLIDGTVRGIGDLAMVLGVVADIFAAAEHEAGRGVS